MREEPLRVLVVAGEGPCRRALLEGAAACGGLEVAAAGSLAEAREALARERPGAVLAALDLADGDAAELAAEGVPLVVAVLEGDDRAAARALEAGAADALFPDEWTPRGIGRAVDRALRLGREARSRAAAQGVAAKYRRRLDLITRALDVGFVVISRDYRVLWANHFLQRIFGDAAGRPCHQVYAARDRVCPECGVREVFEQGRERVVREQQGVDRSGRTVWAEVVAVPIREGGGEVVAALELALPITERVETERALRESEARYRRLSREFQAVLDGIPDSLSLQSPELRVLWANRGAAEGAGFALEELAGRRCHEIWHGREEPCESCPVRRCLADGEPAEECVAGPDGRLWELRGVPVRDEAGAVVGAIEVGRDVTDARAAEGEREALIRKLERKNEELERFTHTVSHDLKAPLTTIRGFASLLLRELDAGRPERVRTHARRIEAAGERMQELLDELLRLSLAGDLAGPLGPVPLSEVSREALENLAGALAERRVAVAVEPDLPVVQGDRVRLREVLQNLVGNAVKFLGGRPDPRVEIGSRQGEQGRVVYVRDNGIGVEAEDRESIFGLFRKLDPASPGTGVGLAIVRQIVEAHGGRAWVESEGRGRGATFCFTLGPQPKGRREGADR